MGTKKRKPRTDLIKKVDLLKPVSIDQLGTANDPCFGKFYDLSTPECKRCGDCEVCAIAMGQKTMMKRLEIEKTQKFKDVEELDIKSKQTKKEILIELKKAIRKHVKDYGKAGVKEDIVIQYIYGAFRKDGFRKTRIRKILNKVVTNSSHITKTQNLIKWKM